MDFTEQFELIARDGLTAIKYDALHNVVRGLLRERETLQCMQHPLGFYHVQLFRRNTVTIRLHYWPSKDRPPSSAVTPYHDHVWTLQSCILVGTIQNVVLTLKRDAGAPYVIANITQNNGVDVVVPTKERVAISNSHVTAYSPGDSYSMQVRIFHATNVDDDVAAATIVRSETATSGGPRTLVPFDYQGQAPARAYLNKMNGSRILDEIETLFAR